MFKIKEKKLFGISLNGNSCGPKMDPVKTYNEMIMRKIESLIQENLHDQSKLVNNLIDFANSFFIDWTNSDEYPEDSIEWRVAHCIGVNQIINLKKIRHDNGLFTPMKFRNTYVDTIIQDEYDDISDTIITNNDNPEDTVNIKVQS